MAETTQNFVIGTYTEYINASLPVLNTPHSEAEKNERNKLRVDLMMSFVSKEGPGSKFKSTYERLFKALTLPRGAKEELGITGDFGMEPIDKAELKRLNSQDDE